MSAQTIKGKQKGSLDSYVLFIENGLNLLGKRGVLSYIVPISLTSSDAMAGIHRLLFDTCHSLRISSYAVRPKPVFENAVVNTSIVQCTKTGTPCEELLTTKMYRKSNDLNLSKLMDNLQFVNSIGLTLYGRIPKIGLELERNILSKLFLQKKLSTLLSKEGFPLIYRYAGGRYFKVITPFSNGSSAERPLFFEDSHIRNAIGCLLSSNLSFWFYQIYSDNLNWKSYEIESFPIPSLTNEQIAFLEELYARYLADIEANANHRTSSKESTYKVESFKEYKIVRSKSIIDEIDDYIGPLYGLTNEEIEFIKYYELEFRMSGM